MLVVLATDAVVQPFAVMVKILSTSTASAAVLCVSLDVCITELTE